MTDFIVHTIPGSPYVRAVLATLEEKGASWRLIPHSFDSVQTPEHVARNPFRRVPVLEHDGFSLYETQAILRYLDRVLPTPALTPKDPRSAARMDQVLGINDWYLFQGCITTIGVQHLVRPRLTGLPPDQSVIDAAMPHAERTFAELATLLGDQEFFAGDTLSLADLAVAPQLDFLARTPEWAALSAPHAALVAWWKRMEARPSLQATTMEKVVALAKAA